jgi:hypothetical protein
MPRLTALGLVVRVAEINTAETGTREHRENLYLTDNRLVAYFSKTTRVSDHDPILSTQGTFVQRIELTPAQYHAAHDWLRDKIATTWDLERHTSMVGAAE